MGQTLAEIVTNIDTIPDGYVDKETGIRKAFQDFRDNPVVSGALTDNATFDGEYSRTIGEALNNKRIFTPFFSFPRGLYEQVEDLEQCIGETPKFPNLLNRIINPTTLGVAIGVPGAVLSYFTYNSDGFGVGALGAAVGFFVAGGVGALIGFFSVSSQLKIYNPLKQNAIYLDQIYQKYFSSPQ